MKKVSEENHQMQIEIDTVLHCMLMWQQILSSGLEEMWRNGYGEHVELQTVLVTSEVVGGIK